jgi:transcriptional regulator with XRE-family HTH domain
MTMATPKKATTYLDIDEDGQRAFAERLKAFRKRHGLTQVELSAGLGFHRTTIMGLENLIHRPFPSTLKRFAEMEAKVAEAADEELEGLIGLS